MNRKEFARVFARKYDITNDLAKEMCFSVFETLKEQIDNGEDIYIYGFGTLKHKIRKSKILKHPKTGEFITVPEKTIVVFSETNSKKTDNTENAGSEEN